MANKIQIRRGLKKDLPELSVGEFAFITDTNEVYIGTNIGNFRVDGKAQETADSAYSTANNAVVAAGTAQETADSAYSTANNAVVAAGTAQETADSAYSTANNAVVAAGTAQETANSAYSTANNAVVAAGTAQETADSAYDVASVAGKDASLINTGVLPVLYGGTGATTAGAAFDILAKDVENIKIGVGVEVKSNGNTAIGYAAIASKSASTAIGGYTKASETFSSSLGYSANASGIESIAIGSRANARGEASIAIGNQYTAADVLAAVAIGGAASAKGEGASAVGANAEATAYGSTALGLRATTSEAEVNYMQLGSKDLSVLRSRVSLTVTSDGRDKADIADIEKGLEFINSVRPVQYVTNSRNSYLKSTKELSEDDLAKKSKYGLSAKCYDKTAHEKGTKKGGRKRVGVIAQEVQAALKSVYGSTDYANIVSDNLFDEYAKGDVPEDVESQLMVGYTEFVPFLIQAVQTLTKKVEYLESLIK